MPVLMVRLVGRAGRCSSCSTAASSVDVFRALWAINLVTYLLITLSTFALDPATARRTWWQGVTVPRPDQPRDHRLRRRTRTLAGELGTGLLLFTYVWLSASMLAAYLVKRVGGHARCGWLARPLLYVVGYGPLLCAITATAYLKELRAAPR